MVSLEMEYLLNVIRKPIPMEGKRFRYIYVTALIQNAYFYTITNTSHLVYIVYI